MHEPSLKASTVMIGVKGWPCTYFCNKSVFSEDRIFQLIPWATEPSNRVGPPAHAAQRWVGNSTATQVLTMAVLTDWFQHLAKTKMSAQMVIGEDEDNWGHSGAPSESGCCYALRWGCRKDISFERLNGYTQI